MIQNVLHDIGGVGLYGVISVCLFFIVFGVALLRACRLSRPFIHSMGRLPLDDGSPAPSERTRAHAESASAEGDPEVK